MSAFKRYFETTPDCPLTTAGEKVTHLRFDLSRNDGGINYFSYKTEPKCWQLSVSAIVREQRDGFVSERHGISLGQSSKASFRNPLRTCTRFNAHTEKKIIAAIDPLLPELATAIMQDGEVMPILDRITAAAQGA